MNKLWLGILFLISSQTFAGSEVGNGGDVVICKDNQGNFTKATILDVYEAQEMRNIKLDLGGQNLSIDEKWQYLFKRISQISPHFAKFLKDEVVIFNKEAKFLNDIILNDIPDSDHLYIPKGCQIEQIAIQREPEFSTDSRYIISHDLWKLLDKDNKIALTLHEIIYKIAIKSKHTDSKKTRYLNSLLFSEEGLKFQGLEFAKLIKKLNISNENLTYNYKGYEFLCDNFSEGSSYVGGQLKESKLIKIFEKNLLIDNALFYQQESNQPLAKINLPCEKLQSFKHADFLNVTMCGGIDFYPNGNLKEIDFADDSQSKGTIVIHNQKVNFSGTATFDEDENISSLNATSPYTLSIFDNNIPLIGHLEFTNGELQVYSAVFHSYKLAKNTTINIGSTSFLMDKDLDRIVTNQFRFYFEFRNEFMVQIPNQPLPITCGGRASFYENGQLESCRNDKDAHYFIRRDGSRISLIGGVFVHFDEDGYFLYYDY